MSDLALTKDDRRIAILDAAIEVFCRYGFKKTSMDDLARAAGISRQGLYLHFRTKEALFKEGVVRLISVTRAAGRAALAREDLDARDRILHAFEAMHADAIGESGGEHMSELLVAATELMGPVVLELEQGIIADVARVLRNAGVAARWKNDGVSAKDLAEHLYSVSCGVKHRVANRAEYREKMRIATQIVCGKT